MALTLEQWQHVAMQRGVGGRDALEVKQRWLNHLRPSLKKVPRGEADASWSAEERTKLEQLSTKYDQSNVSPSCSSDI